jgi:ATP-dependent Lon protease
MTSYNKNKNKKINDLPLRDIVIFPKMTTTILIGRQKSIQSIEEARRAGAPIFAVTQINPDSDEFEQKNLYATGTVCNIIEAIRTADGTFKVILQGSMRALIKKVLPPEKSFCCEIEI